MSKIKVDQIESSDVNVKLAPKSTNAIQVKGAGNDDAAVKLTSASGAHGVKIKSPNHSASQSHTLVLPDNTSLPIIIIAAVLILLSINFHSSYQEILNFQYNIELSIFKFNFLKII